MHGYWEFRSRYGTFRIFPRQDRWSILCNDEDLGSYRQPDAALEDLVGGHCSWPSIGDPSRFGLPDELSAWTFVPLC